MLYLAMHMHEYGATPYVFDWKGKEPPDIERLTAALGIEYEPSKDESLELLDFPDVHSPLSEDDYCHQCQDCDATDGVESTPCGSFCKECFDGHCQVCGVCAHEDPKFPLH